MAPCDINRPPCEEIAGTGTDHPRSTPDRHGGRTADLARFPGADTLSKPSFPRSAWECSPRRSASSGNAAAERPRRHSHAERGNEGAGVSTEHKDDQAGALIR